MMRVLYRPEVLLVGTFAALILIGTILLSLPVAHAQPGVTVLDAFFTATSAVCVTGLIVVDTATAYSRFGQAVILVLIQLGGLGVMTFAAVAVQLLGRRVSFGSQAALMDVFFQGELRGNLRAAVQRIVLLTLVLEALGMAVLWYGISSVGAGGWFEALFLSVSAYCNAGFSVYTDNLVALSQSLVVVWAIMFLIVAGGMGYAVLLEILRRVTRTFRRIRQTPVGWTLNSRIVIGMSAMLIVGGAVLLLATGVNPGDAAHSLPRQVIDALFQSVTARTAGFNTVDIAQLPVPSLMILIPLMFIGGSPGSCAGGIKTTSAAVWAGGVFARLSGQEDVTLIDRRVPEDIVRRARLVVALSALWNGIGVFLLAIIEGVGPEFHLQDLIFEQVSAFCTVGLSTGVTPTLSTVGRLWIIATMFAGRLGPLTVALVVIRPQGRSRFEYTRERVMIG